MRLSRLPIALVLAGTALASNALDRFLQKPDPAYRYEIKKELPGKGYKAFLVEMTSQRWRTAEEVDAPEWRHWLTIIQPEKVTTGTALLMISGGSKKDSAPSRVNPYFAAWAVSNGAVVAELLDVPNEPLVFAGDPTGRKRTEDQITAWTWKRYLETKDETWPIHLPMAKAAVRAMDTVSKVAPAAKEFVLAGGSKRGWTAWLAAAGDHRVKAVIPAVIDMLNFVQNVEHHYRAYGFFSPAVADFEEFHLITNAAKPENRKLIAIEDPWTYRARLKMPKYIINAAGDMFFPPDSSRFYYGKLPGETYLRYVPNADHNLNGSDALAGIGAFFTRIVAGTPAPRWHWRFRGQDSIEVTATDRPTKVLVWRAVNPEARDFRVRFTKARFQSEELQPDNKGRYTARMARPEKGFGAFFIELNYAGWKVTSGVRIVPDVLPFSKPTPK